MVVVPFLGRSGTPPMSGFIRRPLVAAGPPLADSRQRWAGNNTASGDYGVALGQNNVASGDFSTALGRSNEVYGNTSGIFTGNAGEISGANSFMGSGGDSGNANSIDADFAVIVGGLNATIATSGVGAFIGAGNMLANDAQYASLLGGHTNTIDGSAQYSSLLGGLANSNGTEGDWSAHLGGHTTTLNASGSVAYGYHPAAGATISQADTAYFGSDNTMRLGMNENGPFGGHLGRQWCQRVCVGGS